MRQRNIEALLKTVLASAHFLALSGCGFSCGNECAKAPAVTDEDRRARGAAEPLLAKEISARCDRFCLDEAERSAVDAGVSERIQSAQCDTGTPLGAAPAKVTCNVTTETATTPVVVDARALVAAAQGEVEKALLSEGGRLPLGSSSKEDHPCQDACERVPAAAKWRSADFDSVTFSCQLSGVDLVCNYAGSCSDDAGRRPPGLVRASAEGHGVDAEGLYWARMAYLEEASITAFRLLARELEHHGAPRSLVRRARAAVRDEQRHARLCRQEAARRGCRPACPQVRKQPLRDLVAIGIDNAVEGCVKETFAALVVLFRAKVARAPNDAALFASIGRDETRHAQLSWDVDGWIRTRLPVAEADRIDDARSQALATLVSTTAPVSGLADAFVRAIAA